MTSPLLSPATRGSRTSRPALLASTLLALSLACGSNRTTGPGTVVPPLLPAPTLRVPQQELEPIEAIFSRWNVPLPALRVIGNIYHVGSVGVSAWLITTPEGHILLDTALPETAGDITRGIEGLGFKITDIRLLLGSHAHVDHVGAHALIQRRSNARVVLSEADRPVLESGGGHDFLPYPPWPPQLLAYEPLVVDQVVGDGDSVSLGGVTMTAHLTPGHSRGNTTWTMQVSERGQTHQVVFAGSLNLNPGVHLIPPTYPEIESDLVGSIETIRSLPCDVLLAGHGDDFGLVGKAKRAVAGETPNPFIDPDGCKAFVDAGEARYRDQLQKEQLAAEHP
jgi:metallo-beta-lactamase class B